MILIVATVFLPQPKEKKLVGEENFRGKTLNDKELEVM